MSHELMIRAVLQEVEALRGLSDVIVDAMVAAVEELHLPAATHLFRAGDPADAMFIIRSGAVRVITELLQGGVPVTVRLTAGALIGVAAVLGGGHRAASVLTETPCMFLRLTTSRFQDLAEQHPGLRSRVEALAARSRETLIPEGDAGIRLVGHRDYVGGMWEVIGTLQFDFLVSQGLRPSHCLLDIACGALRGGVHFIRYLNPGNYLGLEKEHTLVALGIERELGAATTPRSDPSSSSRTALSFTSSRKHRTCRLPNRCSPT